MVDGGIRIGTNIKPLSCKPMDPEQRRDFLRGVEDYMGRSGLAMLNERTARSTILTGKDYSIRITPYRD